MSRCARRVASFGCSASGGISSTSCPTPRSRRFSAFVGSGLPMLPHPYLRAGQRVRITRGPLADLEGVLVRINPKKGLLVVSVNLLRRSIAVQLDCTALEAA